MYLVKFAVYPNLLTCGLIRLDGGAAEETKSLTGGEVRAQQIQCDVI